MNSAEDAEVTAINIKSSVAAAPPLPSIATAAFGRTRPAVTSASAIRRGYVGKTGLDSRASAARPIVVAASQGIANHLTIAEQMLAYLRVSGQDWDFQHVRRESPRLVPALILPSKDVLALRLHLR